MKKIFVPPIKSQGIKTKLVPWITSSIENIEYGRWVEPFMGTGVVAFNVRPQKALLCDSNPHLIRFYKGIQSKEITAGIVKDYLTKEGEILLKSNGDHYYTIRQRFNQNANPLDFLFLSRACFNGMMRFNKNGGFNVPFCRKPNRFAQALITKISNQVHFIAEIIDTGDYTFKTQDFNTTLSEVNVDDLIYSDPPYIGRHVDYFDSWSETDELSLEKKLSNSGAKFILSTWLSNKYRTNEYIFSVWKNCNISTIEHFYHVGAKESNRNAVYEALLSNFRMNESISVASMSDRINENISQLTTTPKIYKKPQQLSLVLAEEQKKLQHASKI